MCGQDPFQVEFQIMDASAVGPLIKHPVAKMEGAVEEKAEFIDTHFTEEVLTKLSGQPFQAFSDWWKERDQLYNKKSKAPGRWNIYCPHGGEATRKFKSIAQRNSNKCDCPFSVTLYDKEGKVGWAKNPILNHVHVLKDKFRVEKIDPNMFIDLPDIEVT